MARIYSNEKITLNKLLDRAGDDKGATILIPDLQRPYVWTPNQVTKLVDSIIRGWPFGGLLLWKVRGDLSEFPAREFWKVVNKTDEGDHEKVSHKNAPTEYLMVLDGQQRVQSLLLAFYGDNWGFRLLDKEWTHEVQDRQIRKGQRGKHWSLGNLCIDLKVFVDEYQRLESHTIKRVTELNYENVLKWVVTNRAEGQSKSKKLSTYIEPLYKSFEPENRGRFIRLSRFWNDAVDDSTIPEGHYQPIVGRILAEHSVDDFDIKLLSQPLAQLMKIFGDLKQIEVAYLEVVEFNPRGIWTRDSYNDSVVSIFTRLNTAGRTLTKEEITFAWLKTFWDESKTDNHTAVECFEELKRELKESGSLSLETDEVVGAVSLVWSVVFNKGRLLSNKELLRGEFLKPMAPQLAGIWKVLAESILESSSLIKQRELEYRVQYQSLNALALLWAIGFLGKHWLSKQLLPVTSKDSYVKSLQRLLNSYSERWLIGSQWAEKWTAASSTYLANVVVQLSEDYSQLETTTNADAALDILNKRLEYLVNELASDAVNSINNKMAVSTRDRVSDYYTALWIWHRLDGSRWKQSSVALTTPGRKKDSLDVDHVAAFGLWERKIKTMTTTLTKEEVDELTEDINQIGNCILLRKTFNVSKGMKPMQDFLSEVNEFTTGTLVISDWKDALALDDMHIRPESVEISDLQKILEVRTQKVKSDLVEFIKGTKTRCDI